MCPECGSDNIIVHMSLVTCFCEDCGCKFYCEMDLDGVDG